MCAICGESPATTRDHIPPRGIYPKPRANGLHLHTVPSCAHCNNAAGPEDEEFKVLIGFGAEDGHRPQDVVIDSIAKTVGSNQRIAEQIFSTKRHGYAQRRGSVFEPAIAVTFDWDTYCKVITRMVRALYWRRTGNCLGKHSEIRVFSPQAMNTAFTQSMKELMDCLKPYQLNQKTFVYKVQFRDDGTSIWGMQFLGKHTVFGYAEAPKTIAPDSSPDLCSSGDSARA